MAHGLALADAQLSVVGNTAPVDLVDLSRRGVARGSQIELPPARIKVCRGRMFSPRDYVIDITEWGFADVVGRGLEERHEPVD